MKTGYISDYSENCYGAHNFLATKIGILIFSSNLDALS